MFCKCKICGKELSSKRAAHGHLITMHTNEYRAANFKQSAFMLYSDDKDYKPATPEDGSGFFDRSETKPRGLRHLNLNLRIEAAAANEIDEEYNETYEYIDNDGNCYTEAEIIKRGWL